MSSCLDQRHGGQFCHSHGSVGDRQRPALRCFVDRHAVTIVCGSNVDLDAYHRWVGPRRRSVRPGGLPGHQPPQVQRDVLGLALVRVLYLSVWHWIHAQESGNRSSGQHQTRISARPTARPSRCPPSSPTPTSMRSGTVQGWWRGSRRRLSGSEIRRDVFVKLVEAIERDEVDVVVVRDVDPSDAEPVGLEPVREGGGRAPRAAQRLCRPGTWTCPPRRARITGDGGAAAKRECAVKSVRSRGVFRGGSPDGPPFGGCHGCILVPSVRPAVRVRA
jgi:hypothetical protein